MPSAASSAKASLSSSTLTETKATPCLMRNSFILRQLVQPGCQYAFITEASGDTCVMACSTHAQDTAFTRGFKDSTINAAREILLSYEEWKRGKRAPTAIDQRDV